MGAKLSVGGTSGAESERPNETARTYSPRGALLAVAALSAVV